MPKAYIRSCHVLTVTLHTDLAQEACGSRHVTGVSSQHYNQTLLCYKKRKVEDALCVRFDPLACVTYSLVDYVSFISFGCLRGAALTISPGHMVRVLDLKLDTSLQVQVTAILCLTCMLTLPQIVILTLNFTNTAFKAKPLISLSVLYFYSTTVFTLKVRSNYNFVRDQNRYMIYSRVKRKLNPACYVGPQVLH
jgi:hypothetical protein